MVRAGFAGLVASAGVAHASDGQSVPSEDKGANSEIVVTAERRAENLATVPISMTAISADEIERARVRGVADWLALTPNVSFVNNGSRDRVDISIRGVSNQLDPSGNVRPSAYAFYINDFNVSAITSNPQITDMRQIEILRGPQGTFFGRNAEAGAINISTRQPENRWYEEGTFGYSSFDTRLAGGVLNAPLLPNLALRISGQDEVSDGNIRNINPVGGGNDHRYQTVRAILRFQPDARVDWDTSFDYSKERSGMRDGVPTGFLTATWRSVYYRNAPGNVASPDGVGFYPANDDRVNFNTPQAVGSTYYWGRTRFKYSFDTMTLTAIAGYGHSRIFNRGDVDGGSLDLFNETNALTRDTLNGELRLQSSDEGRFEWNVGISGGRDTGFTLQQTFYGSQNGFGRPAGSEITGVDSRSTDSYAAVFGQATYRLTGTFDVTVGGRYSYEHVTGRFLNRSNGVVNNNEPHRAATFNDFSPKISLRYMPQASLMFYMTASKGFKTGGVQQTQAAIQNSYKPETLWNFEGGIKASLFDGRVSLDIAGFYERWTDLQQSQRFQFLSPTGSLLFVAGIANAAKAHAAGAEGSVSVRPATGLTLSGHLAYTDAVYDRYPNAFVDGLIFDASGKPLTDAPRWTAGVSGQYERPLSATLTGFARIDWNYRSSILSSSFALRYNSFPFISPGYGNINLRLGVEHKNVVLTFYVDNLLNKRYFANAYEKAFYSGVQVVPSYRRVGFSLTLRHF
ncbi:MAG: hypothetical protein JWR80_1748 [Bradyrhizobium sp.]|nr:hypothetical protein [Bradyrhizobium sp.]